MCCWYVEMMGGRDVSWCIEVMGGCDVNGCETFEGKS